MRQRQFATTVVELWCSQVNIGDWPLAKLINWGDIRKKYELKGRWEAYVVSSFEGIEDKIQQNKEVQYKHPHFVESTWEGAYKNEDTLGQYASDHPYGDVYLVKLWAWQRMKTI